MTNCIYRWPTIDPLIVRCDNSHDLIHNGFVSAEFCSGCRYRTESTGDFWQQTAALSARTRSHVKPKACGECPEVKRRDPATLQFVWPYFAGGAQGDELRWSIRSVDRFYAGTASVLVIGDKPDWYTGPFIQQQRVSARHPNRSFRDMLSKVWRMATDPAVAEQFIWMMDDIYFLQSFTLADVATPRCDPYREKSGGGWQRRKRNTMRALADRGYSTHDYATHLPHHVEKQKLQDVFREFDLHSQTMLWEVLYGNRFRENPLPARAALLRVFHELPPEQYIIKSAGKLCLNNANGGWSRNLRNYLHNLLPEPSQFEAGGEVTEPKTYRTPRMARQVKRRPLHTHRAFIEANRATE